MGLVLIAALIGVPMIEIAVFIQVGDWIGLWPTLALVILSAVVGSWQLRTQGFATLARARAEMDRGRVPAHEIFDGLCLLFAGALLLTPGFVTDTVGLLLFIPAVRALLRLRVGGYMARHAETHVYRNGEEVYRGGPRQGGGGRDGARPGGPGSVIDGDYVDLTDEEPPANDNGGRLDDRNRN